MDFSGFFNGFGDDFFSSGKKAEKKAEKKPEKKGDTKKDAGKTADKKATGDCDVTLPVTVKARGFVETVGGSGTKKLSELEETLIEMGYDQMKLPGMNLFYMKETNTVYVSDSAVCASGDDDQAFIEEDSKLVIADGMIKCEIGPENFPDKEYDDITVSDVAEYWTSVNPHYGACTLAVDFDASVAYPVLPRRTAKADEDTITVYVNGSPAEVNTADKDSAAAIGKELAGEMGGANAILYEGKEVWFLSYEAGKLGKYSKTAAKAATKSKKVEKKYPLPMTLHVVNWNMDYNLTAEMFDGKESVTKDDINKVMASQESLFADKGRRADYLYNEEKKFMSCMFLSGRKGATALAEVPVHSGFCKMIRSAEELEKVRKMDMFSGVFCELAQHFKILALPHGNFLGYFGKEKECCTVKRVEFERKLPKIGREVLDGVIEFFRRKLPVEGAVRIMYNRNTGEFFTIYAEGFATRTAIFYDFSHAQELLCMPGMVQVCEIHSHNTMPAFFSSTDDADERYAGVFGVIGNLDKPIPSIKFRAGMDGVFTPVSVNELFN